MYIVFCNRCGGVVHLSKLECSHCGEPHYTNCVVCEKPVRGFCSGRTNRNGPTCAEHAYIKCLVCNRMYPSGEKVVENVYSEQFICFDSSEKSSCSHWSYQERSFCGHQCAEIARAKGEVARKSHEETKQSLITILWRRIIGTRR
jgi:hypothetical protein